MAGKIALAGQWLGAFIYGPAYGDDFYGEKVSFRLFLQNKGTEEFEGTSVDIDGLHSNFDQAVIKGFTDGNFISFTKEYAQYFLIDEDGNREVERGRLPRLSYSGEYNANSGKFAGEWELLANEELCGDSSIVEVFTGTWEMRKDD